MRYTYCVEVELSEDTKRLLEDLKATKNEVVNSLVSTILNAHDNGEPDGIPLYLIRSDWPDASFDWYTEDDVMDNQEALHVARDWEVVSVSKKVEGV